MDITEDTPFQVLRKTWQPVALSRDLEAGGVVGYTLLEEPLAIARFEDGTLLATRDACPHKGMALSCGHVDDGRLRCAYHGWEWGTDGACVGVPSLKEPPQRLLDKAALDTFDVRERYGMVWVKLDPDEAASIPDVPEFDGVGDWQVLVAEPMAFACGFRREIENYLDMTHFAFAHGTTLGAAADVVLPPMEINRLEDGFEMKAPFPSLEAPGQTPTKLQSCAPASSALFPAQRHDHPSDLRGRRRADAGPHPEPQHTRLLHGLLARSAAGGLRRSRRWRIRSHSRRPSSRRTASCASASGRARSRSARGAAAGASSSRPATRWRTRSRSRSEDSSKTTSRTRPPTDRPRCRRGTRGGLFSASRTVDLFLYSDLEVQPASSLTHTPLFNGSRRSAHPLVP